MSDPLVPNFKKGVGRLATDRFDFEDHIEGKRFRHQANQIDLFPTVVISSVTVTNVQDAIARLATLIAPPVIPDATTTSKGIVRLNGDIGGTATSVSVIGLQQRPVSAAAPTANQVLTWNGSVWIPQFIVSSFVAGGDLSGTSTSQQVIALTGTGVSPDATVVARNDVISFIDSATPVINQDVAVSGAGGNFVIQAQGASTGTGGAGGTLQLKGGDIGGFEGDTYGGAILQLGDDTHMVEPAHIGNSSSGSRVLGLVTGTALTSTNMPLNSGKMVVFIGNATSTPSASPVGGTVLYSSGGKLSIQQGDGANFVITPNVLPTRSTASNTPFGVGDVVILVDTTSSALTITLPQPTLGRRVTVKDFIGNASVRNITIARFAAEKIEGLSANKIISANWGSITLVANGTDWFII